MKFVNNFLFVFSLLCLTAVSCKGSNGNPVNDKPDDTPKTTPIFLADPTIFHDNGKYYLYGTGGNHEGFLVYESDDLKSWQGPAGARNGYALMKGDTYGTTGFWAPQVFKSGNTYYMAYTANEQIAVAQSDSPLGPFKQQAFKTISGPGKQIDPFVFKDDDGKVYLYHVRLQNGNRIFAAEMNDNFSDIKPETAKECIAAEQGWENTASAPWPVAEGPTLLKHDNLYYLFYSANDFRNINYAVGYAVAETPLGPWEKFSGNPIISRHMVGKNGPGHGDFVKDKNGNWFYVLHTHRSENEVSPRVTAIIQGKFTENGTAPDKMIMDAESFHYLNLLSK